MCKLRKICLLLLSTLLISFVICDSEYIMTVKNTTHLICIVDSLTSPIYIDPPVTTKSETLDFLRRDEFWSDWSIKDSFEIMPKHITDKRWEDFATIENNYNLFQNVSYVSFSIYSPETIEFHISDLKSLEYTTIVEPENSNGRWRHYSVISNNSGVDIYEDGQLNHRVNSLTPQEIVVKTPVNKFWKIHNYTLRMATVISRFPTDIFVPPDIDCLTFYVFLCSHCSLLVDFGGGKNHTFSGDYGVHSFSVDSGSHVRVIRNTLTDKDVGLWQIDAWKCPNTKSGKAIYEATMNETYKRTCNTLANHNEHKYDKRKTKADNPLCEMGWLGRSCHISCENLLGPDKKTCQEHEICHKLSGKMECFCAWGYSGSFCDAPCSYGSWGLNCKRECPAGCISCDTITGKCSYRSGFALITFLVIAFVVSTAALLTTLFCLMKYRRNYRLLKTTNEENQN